MTRRSWFLRGLAAATVAVTLGVIAAWPIYGSPWLVVAAAASVFLGAGVVAAAASGSWPPLVAILVVLAVFALTVVPVAEPQRLSGLSWESLPGLGRGVIDGLAAIVLGWKQLLTLTLPLGIYQSVLVPAYLVFLLCVLLSVAAAVRGGRIAPLAAIPLLAPVAFGTIFGAAEASTSVRLGIVVVEAPRELALWCAAGALAAIWVVWSSGVDRRVALRRGMPASPRESRSSTHAPTPFARPGVPGASSMGHGRLTRWGLGLGAGALALVAALFVTPLLAAVGGGEREALRERVDPQIILRKLPSPLASYRVFKRDDALDVPLFSVAVEGPTPARLRLAVLDEYDGVDFHVGAGEAELFTRFPSAGQVPDPTRVTIGIRAGYSDIWVPMAELGSVPDFTGPRAETLADALFVNRSSGAAIAVPEASGAAASARATDSSGAPDPDDSGLAGHERLSTAEGLREGDGLRAVMRAESDPVLSAGPVRSAASLASDPEAAGVALDAMPQLAEWLSLQRQSAGAAGLTELIDRLRARGYLSHSLSDDAGERAWLDRLSEQYGTGFSPSAGGQSIARIEELFAQLNAQQRAAGNSASARELVAAVGDDEQFAVAGALIARALGYDSRVVLGVRLDDSASPPTTSEAPEPGVPGVPACHEACTGENLAAWIEVRGSDGLWAPLDVTPQVSIRPSISTEGQRLPEYPSMPDQRDAREVEPPVGVGEAGENSAANVPPRPEPESWWPVFRAGLLGFAALALSAMLGAFLPVAKRLRTRRRRQDPHPELRALGAWQELVDFARDLRVIPFAAGQRGEDPILSSLSRAELAEVLRAAGFADAPWLAEQVDAAVFSASGLGPNDVDELWRRVEQQRGTVLGRSSRWQRLRARYSLRSLGMKFAVSRRRRRESVERQRHLFGGHELGAAVGATPEFQAESGAVHVGEAQSSKTDRTPIGSAESIGKVSS